MEPRETSNAINHVQLVEVCKGKNGTVPEGQIPGLNVLRPIPQEGYTVTVYCNNLDQGTNTCRISDDKKCPRTEFGPVQLPNSSPTILLLPSANPNWKVRPLTD